MNNQNLFSYGCPIFKLERFTSYINNVSILDLFVKILHIGTFLLLKNCVNFNILYVYFIPFKRHE